MKKEKNKSKSIFPSLEEEVLNFWEKGKIFEKSITSGEKKKDYVFYDGPPFATGTPHYGHIVASVMKDAVPRYWTMRGYRVERRWGWDCHGLPIENIVEKEIDSKGKKDIEEKIGVEKFNEMCRSKVLGYVDEWKKVVRKLGRWADMENSYKTMDLDFMESVWHVFKELFDKGLIYEGYRSMHICPRCETTLSQSEVAEGYKDIKDLSVIAKFELVDEPGIFILAWTTTPWTLIGNVALAINPDIEYLEIVEACTTTINSAGQQGKYEIPNNEKYVIAKNIFAKEDQKLSPLNKSSEVYIYNRKNYRVIKEIKGKDLIGKKYKPLFDYYSKDESLENHKNGWKIYGADFVTTEDGTGVVHIAPAFGEDDMNLGKKENLPFVQHVGMDGIIKKEAKEFAGMNVKLLGDHTKTDVEIIKYLAKKNLLFAKEKYEHSYPHCWRCETPLINYATSSWFVSIEKIKDKMLKTAKDINWSPKYIKEGRFGNWLEGARDWSISRQRFWASVMPIWKC
ncbi:MAG: class I tRNA ligase family protein, partial [Candidatus Falkowbacteria bacterium]